MNSTERELVKIIVSLEAAWSGLMRLGKIIEANGMFATRKHFEDELDAYRRQAAIEAQEAQVPIPAWDAPC